MFDFRSNKWYTVFKYFSNFNILYLVEVWSSGNNHLNIPGYVFCVVQLERDIRESDAILVELLFM